MPGLVVLRAVMPILIYNSISTAGCKDWAKQICGGRCHGEIEECKDVHKPKLIDRQSQNI
eukprot:scaffold9147_cov39-Prasinocladus_malaysianus.AAC.1